MKPKKLGHEAHCPKNYRPNPSGPDKCDCNYPELERLRQEVIDRQETETSLLEWNEKLSDDLAKYGAHRDNCAWHLVGTECCCGLREALGQPTEKPDMFECDCGNKYNIKYFNARTFNCFCCGMSLTIA